MEASVNGRDLSTHRPQTVREKVDFEVSQGFEAICLAIMRETQDMAQQYPHGQDVVKKTSEIIEYLHNLDDDVAFHQAACMLRYLLEGREGSYHSDPAPLRWLMSEGSSKSSSYLSDGQSLLDLGAGPGTAVREWHARGLALGVELSPTFVLKDIEHLRIGVIDGPPSTLNSVLNGRSSHQKPFDAVVSSLTVDRVADPERLIRNMMEQTAPGGTFAFFNLFPVLAEDDEPGLANPLVYTPKGNRLTETGSVALDLKNLRQRIEDRHRILLRTARIPYTVTSASGVQHYETYYGLIGRKNLSDHEP